MDYLDDDEQENNVFISLYTNKSRASLYREIDKVSSEQKELQKFCSFSPQIIGDSPFVSERTLREYSKQPHRFRRRKPPPPPSPERKSNHTTPIRNKNDKQKAQSSIIGGNYCKDSGYKDGPPLAAGIPIYYFDPSNPPSFDTGKYYLYISEEIFSGENSNEGRKRVKDSSDEDEDSTVDKTSTPVGEDSGGLKAPPLPPWAFTDGPSSEKKKNVIKIVKQPRKEVVQEVGGWQAVLQEMAKKKAGKEGGSPLKKAQSMRERPRLTKKKSKRKKGKDFKDIMDELSYKLAKMRGDVGKDEDDEDDDDESVAAFNPDELISPPPPSRSDTPIPKGQPPPPPPTPINGKVSSTGEDSTASSPGVGVRKLASKPNLVEMLSKVHKVAAPPNLEKSLLQRTKSAPIGLSLGSDTKEVSTGVLAVPKPESLPFAPPLPNSWPPVAVILPESDDPPPAVDVEKKKKVKKEKKKSLKDIFDSVAIEKKVEEKNSGSKTTVMKRVERDLPEGYYMEQPVPDLVLPGQISTGGTTTLALCISMNEQLGGENTIRDSSQERGKQLPSAQEETKPFYFDKKTISDLPLPTDFHLSVDRMRKSNEKREIQRKQKESMAFRSFLYQSNAAQSTSPDSYSTNSKKTHLTIAHDFVSNVDKHFDNKTHSFRKPAEHSRIDQLPLSDRMSDTVVNSASKMVGKPLDKPTSFWVSNLRSSNSVTTPLKAGSTSSSMNESSFGTPSYHFYSNGETYEKGKDGMRYLMNFRPQTEPKAPRFQSNDLIDRRQSVRKAKEDEEYQAQREAMMKEKEKKEILRKKALLAAQQAGVYKKNERYHQHQKIVEKYSRSPQIGSKVNIGKLAADAYHEYSMRHHLAQNVDYLSEARSRGTNSSQSSIASSQQPSISNYSRDLAYENYKRQLKEIEENRDIADLGRHNYYLKS